MTFTLYSPWTARQESNPPKLGCNQPPLPLGHGLLCGGIRIRTSQPRHLIYSQAHLSHGGVPPCCGELRCRSPVLSHASRFSRPIGRPLPNSPLVPRVGLEPTRLLVPKTRGSANSPLATSAFCVPRETRTLTRRLRLKRNVSANFTMGTKQKTPLFGRGTCILWI